MLPQVRSGILCFPDLSTALTTQRERSRLRPTKLARKGQGWNWLCTVQGKISPFSHCHATEGLLPLQVAVMGWKPSSLPVPGAWWSLLALAGMGQGGRSLDGANTGAHMDVSPCSSTSRTAIYRVSSGQTMGYFQCGLQNAPGIQETLPILPVLGVTSGPGRANSLLCMVAQQCPHMSLSLHCGGTGSRTARNSQEQAARLPALSRTSA